MLIQNFYIGLAIIYIIVIVVSVPGNILILASVISDKRLRTPTNALVCNLSIAGLIIAILRLPIKIYELFHPFDGFPFPNSVDMCRFQQILPTACVLCISITLTTICIDRYVAIVHPMQRQLKMTRKKVFIFIPTSWIVSFCCFIVYASYMVLYDFGGKKYCIPYYPEHNGSDIILTNASGYPIGVLEATRISLWATFIPAVFLIPSIIMITFYSITARNLWSEHGPSDSVKTITLKHHDRRRDQKKKAIKILITCCVVFVITNFPYYTIFMLLDLQLITLPRRSIITNTLILINYSAIAYNPIIYGYFNIGVRSRARKVLRYMSYAPTKWNSSHAYE
ncbi:Substance-K receptor [Trichoplax sp. H2]|nr:Substance-K receptor [Trichoplax sp. H2]|eukprot:RDD38008.1 Substance-K receptor [Trichoplax sp. H2]